MFTYENEFKFLKTAYEDSVCFSERMLLCDSSAQKVLDMMA